MVGAKKVQTCTGAPSGYMASLGLDLDASPPLTVGKNQSLKTVQEKALVCCLTALFRSVLALVHQNKFSEKSKVIKS